MHEQFFSVNEKKELSEFGLPVVRNFMSKNGKIKMMECEKEGADWKKILENQEKKFLEIGGPSFRFTEDDIIDFNEYSENLVRMNNGKHFETPNDEGIKVSTKEYTDVVGDAVNLPFPDKSFGAVFVRNFRMDESQRKLPRPKPNTFDLENTQLIRSISPEVKRVLDENGLLVWLNMEKPDFNTFISDGFVPLFYQKREFENSTQRYHAVFIKGPESEQE